MNTDNEIKFRVWVNKPFMKFRKKRKGWMFYTDRETINEDSYNRDGFGDFVEFEMNNSGWVLMAEGTKKYQIAKCPFVDKDGFITSSRDVNSSIMHFSYCQDSNGKDVYEGDIVMVYYHTIDNSSQLPNELNELLGFEKGEFIKLENEKYELHEIVFEDGCFGICSGFIMSPIYNLGRFEVIGNVYENPELLELND